MLSFLSDEAAACAIVRSQLYAAMLVIYAGAAGTKIPAGGVKAALDKLDKNQDGTLDKEVRKIVKCFTVH